MEAWSVMFSLLDGTLMAILATPILRELLCSLLLAAVFSLFLVMQRTAKQ